ncbi:hypothetical protein BGZ90_003360 [Linnemannia elongata]|nr:hypothetical protein BGZ90_003360 [Linnemannia elongata]
MSGPSRSSSTSRASHYREPTDSPSPNIPDEGYHEQRTEVPKWALRLSEEQRAELAVQLLQSVSPMVFSRAYARLTPLLQHRDFLAELPYELTVHLLSYLDEKSLQNVALVSKDWNRFTSDNAVWKGIYVRHGWTVNQDMIDWYLKGSELELASIVLEREQEQEHEDRVLFAARSAVSNGKRRKVVDIDPKDDAAERSGDDYDMLQDVVTPYERYPDEEGDRKLQRFSPTQLDPEHQIDIDNIETLAHAPSNPVEATTINSSDCYDDASSPISIPPSSPISRDASTSPDESSSFSFAGTFGRSRGSSSMLRSPSMGQRQGRFSLPTNSFMPSLHRPRMPIYTLGSNLMTPPSMLRKMSQRTSPPSPIRIPKPLTTISSPTLTSSRPSRFFGHQRSGSADQQQLGSQAAASSSQPLTSPILSGSIPNEPHSPTSTKSLWSVIRHGVMGVSGSPAWPSLHVHRHSDPGDRNDGSGASSHQGMHFHHTPSLPTWLSHFPLPLPTASSRQNRQSASSPASPVTASFSNSTTNSNSTADGSNQPIRKCIDFIGSQAPYPSQILAPEILQTHRDPISGRATINWKYLCMQRKLLEKNWTQGVHSARELPGHTEGIYCIQFDGYKVISGSRDTTIKIWDIRSGECVRTYSGHTASVLCLQYDDTRIVSGSSDTSILVWDLETGQIIQRLDGHVDSVLSVRFEKDIVVSCSKDRTVKIWKISSGQLLKTLRGHRAAVNAVQFSPESAAPSPFRGNPRLVVSASGDKTIKVWSFETGECLRTLEGHARGIACIQFEGNVVVSGSSDQSIKIWDLSTGACINTLAGHEGLVRTLQFAGGRIISGSYDETIKVWDQASGRLLTDLGGRHSHRVFKLQFDDSKIVSCSQDQKIIIWDFAVGVDTTFLN